MYKIFLLFNAAKNSSNSFSYYHFFVLDTFYYYLLAAAFSKLHRLKIYCSRVCIFLGEVLVLLLCLVSGKSILVKLAKSMQYKLANFILIF